MTRDPGTESLAVPLLLERSGTNARPVIVARGEIDVATSPLLRSELTSILSHAPQHVTLDLDGVTFVDSSGLGVLVGALKRLRDAGGEGFTVLHAQDSVRKVFDITGLSAAFELPAT